MIFNTEEIIIGGTEWKTAPFRFNRMFTLAGGSGGSYIDVLLSGVSPLVLTNALADGLNYIKLFGDTEQRNIPSEYTQVNYVTNTDRTRLNTGLQFDFSKNYEIELRVRGVTGSWYILQARDDSSQISGIAGASAGNRIALGFMSDAISTSQISRVTGNIYYIKATINNGNLTLYVKDETAGTEETVTGTYTPTTGQSVNICLFGNTAGNYVGINSDVYFARIKEDNNYIMDYVPCRQNATAGFYDKVSGTFKTTTDLSAGADVTPSPDTPMDIVSNNGVLKLSPNLYGGSYYAVNAASSTVYQPTAIQGDSWTTDGSRRGIAKIVPVKGNTTYTFSVKSLLVAQYLVISQYASIDDMSNVNNALATNGGSNLSYTVTTDANAKYVLVGAWAYPTPTAGQTMSITEPQFELGDTATAYIPYGAIYTDGTVETVQVTGKNLFDKNITPEQIYVTDTAQRYGYLLPLKAGTYTVSCSVSEGNIYCKTYVGGVYGQALLATNTTLTLSEDGYILIYASSSATFTDQTNLQLEQGSTATDYEPYKVLGSADAEMLLSVGDYKDTQEVLGGDVTRNVGIKVLDGTEDWIVQSTYSRYTVVISNLDSNDTNLYCTHLKNSSATQGNCRILSGQRICFYVMESYTTLDDWTQFLADQYANGTPVIVVYPLATSTTETVTAQPLTIQQGTNIVEITEASIDDLTMELSYKQSI